MAPRQLRAFLAGVSMFAVCAWQLPAAQANDAGRPSPDAFTVMTDPAQDLPLPDYPSIPSPADFATADDLIRDAVPPPSELPTVVIAEPTSPSSAPVLSDTPLRPAFDAPPAIVVADPPYPLAPELEPASPAVAVAPPDTGAPPPVDVAAPLPVYPTLAVDFPDDPVSVALRDLATTGPLAFPQGLILSKRDREALVAFYSARDFEPLWVKDKALTTAAKAVARQVQTADLDGMDPDAYPVLLAGPDARPAVLAQAEFTLSASAFAYARDARGGRLEPSRLSTMLTPDLEVPKPDEVLAALLAAADPAAVLADYQPRHAGYVALRRKLAELRDTTATISPRPTLGDGPVLSVGMDDPRVPLLRERLGVAGGDDTVYDAALADAVRAFQRERRLPATGRLDPRTISALQGARPASAFALADIVANMERWRWLPRDLGERHIFVNLPEFTLRLVDAGEVIHTARVIVGKTETPTPVFSHAMDHVIVNPYWHIPPSILRKEVLPGLAADPDWAAKRGYEVIRRGNSISVRQPPGERNALGFIKFMFPNQHSVYLHDTPKRSLFATQQRAYSHGCVRVDQPFRLAEFVLGEQGFTEARMRAMIGKGERTIRLKTPLPVHLAYFTVTVDEAGRLQRVNDLYGHDGRIRTALGLGADGRRYAQLQRSRAQ